MTESNPEVGYYQAVVDDLRVAQERTLEQIHELRTEATQLREIVRLATLYLAALGSHSDHDADDILLTLSNEIDAYTASHPEVNR